LPGQAGTFLVFTWPAPAFVSAGYDEVARARDDGIDPLMFWKYKAANGWSTSASTIALAASSTAVTHPSFRRHCRLAT